MPAVPDNAAAFRALHDGPRPLLLANAWDVGTAKLLAAVGFRALATTSGGHAHVLGRADGTITREEALEHAAELAAATELPVSADLENGYADDPSDVAHTVSLAAETGLAGCSIEDWDRERDVIYCQEHAVARIAAAAAAAHDGRRRLVLTARAENHLRGIDDLGDTIERLQAYADAGADVVYAPGLLGLSDIRRVVEAVDRPLNVLALPGVAPVAELGAAGVRRISVGSGFNLVALGALARAGRELLDAGTYGFWAGAADANEPLAGFGDGS